LTGGEPEKSLVKLGMGGEKLRKALPKKTKKKK